jgi:hypothetical protein
MNDSVEWEDEYAMGWCVVLTGGKSYTEKIGLPVATHGKLF